MPEDRNRQNLGRLFDALRIENLLTYPTEAGPADLYLPRRRTVIETKRSGLAADPDRRQAGEGSETPREQLERYLRAEIEREASIPDLFDTEEERRRPWVGVLTDGRNWHAWRYKHQPGAVGIPVFKDFRPTNQRQLLDRVKGLVGDEPLGKPWIPLESTKIFAPHKESLDALLGALTGGQRQRTETKFQLWLDMLRTSCMAPETERDQWRMFVAHSFLVTIARGVIHTVSEPRQRPDSGRILGDGFVAWILESDRGRNWAQNVLDQIHGYEWRLPRGDILRTVYQNFIDQADRKIFGEYYTPDWLAALLVDDILDDEWCEHAVKRALSAERRAMPIRNVGVLDPTCGSGTFLYHAAEKLLKAKALRNRPPTKKAEIVTRLVHGLDIHPVAVEIARATLLRALPKAPPEEGDAIQIHQGDALITSSREHLRQGSLFSSEGGEFRIETPKGREIFLPKSFAESRSFIPDMRRIVAAASGGEPLPVDVLEGLSDSKDRCALQTAHETIRKVIETEGNSIWAWYIGNITAPILLSERKVDRIVANPPWVVLSDVQVKVRKRALEELAGKPLDKDGPVPGSLELWTGGRQATGFDIAQLFVKRCREKYLSDPKRDPAAWLVNAAAMRAGNWEAFRAWHEAHLEQVLDFSELKQPPFSGAASCALFEHRTCRQPCDRHVMVRTSGEKITSETVPKEAKRLLEFRKARKRTRRAPSDYIGRFRQGATVVPHVLVLLDRVEVDGDEAVVTTKTPGKGSKKPWNELRPRNGRIPREWIGQVLFSEDLFPFCIRSVQVQAIIPINEGGALHHDPRSATEFWRQLDDDYREYRGKGRATPKTLLGNIDYLGKLSRQLPLSDSKKKCVVLYPKSGKIMRAARAPLATTLVNDSVYRWNAGSRDEAAYLVALLNAPTLRTAFADARGSDRDFHLSPWMNVPIPRFDPENAGHTRLAELTRAAEDLAKPWRYDEKNRQITISRRIGETLKKKKILQDIDEITRRLLPDQCEGR